MSKTIFILASFAVLLSVVRIDHAFSFVACVRPQRKRTNVLTDTCIRRSCFLEWRGWGMEKWRREGGNGEIGGMRKEVGMERRGVVRGRQCYFFHIVKTIRGKQEGD